MRRNGSGDATMAPEELSSPYGSISGFEMDDPRPSLYWLNRVADRFPKSVWLNPIPRERWSGNYGAWSLKQIREVFHMEDMTLGGIKGMVEHLSDTTGKDE